MPNEAPTNPVSPEDVDVFRRHPRLRAAIETYAAADLARYHALGTIDRWMASDLGRASLSGTVSVLAALGRMTPAALMASKTVGAGEVSRGRARLYLQRAVANDLIAPVEPGAPVSRTTLLAPTARFHAVMAGVLKIVLEAAATLEPKVAPALTKLGDTIFVQRVTGRIGRITAASRGFFPPNGPVRLFQDRDGGTRMLHDLILRQRPGRERLLESCAVTPSALARASLCSRSHAVQLLKDGEAQGLLALQGGTLTFDSKLSADTERYFASLFAVVSAAAAGVAEPSIGG